MTQVKHEDRLGKKPAIHWKKPMDTFDRSSIENISESVETEYSHSLSHVMSEVTFVNRRCSILR